MVSKTYSVQFREQAVRRVIDSCRPVVDVAKELNVNEWTLANWVRLISAENRWRRNH